MRKRGVDLRGRRAKHLWEFATEQFDLVVTLCDRVREVCPRFPGDPQTMHWSIADPSLDGGAAFERTAVELELRIGFLLHVIRRKQEAHGTLLRLLPGERAWPRNRLSRRR